MELILVPSGVEPVTLSPWEIRARPGTCHWKSPEMDLDSRVVSPRTVTVGTPARTSATTEESIVGFREDVEASQVPSTYRIELVPTRERPDTDGNSVRDEVRF